MNGMSRCTLVREDSCCQQDWADYTFTADKAFAGNACHSRLNACGKSEQILGFSEISTNTEHYSLV